jgi:NAD-dependent SIR2 family protein deacetylase
MSYRELTASRRARQRYWARSTVGWRRIADAQPNAAHRALARLEAAGVVPELITQNVDGLHQKAGHREVLDLHGRLDRVECLDCRTGYRREPFQDELTRLNPGWGDGTAAPRRTVRPDGDVDLGAVDYDAFRLPTCPRCGGDLKPGVVFFGEAVPRRHTEAAHAAVAAADALLVVGSSLMVWSGYRFARQAVAEGKPLALLNLGTTRADGEATLKVEARCGDVLAAVVAELGL